MLILYPFNFFDTFLSRNVTCTQYSCSCLFDWSSLYDQNWSNIYLYWKWELLSATYAIPSWHLWNTYLSRTSARNSQCVLSSLTNVCESHIDAVAKWRDNSRLHSMKKVVQTHAKDKNVLIANEWKRQTNGMHKPNTTQQSCALQCGLRKNRQLSCGKQS